MLLVDGSGRICHANMRACELFGYPREQLVGLSIDVLLPERLRLAHAAHREEYGGNMRVRPMGRGLELFGQRRDGVEFPVEISLSPIQTGTGSLIAAAVREISERKRIEAQLIEARTSAERARAAADEARALAEEARDLAERANLAKGRFLAAASHDLRQPLQALSLLNGTLRRMAQDDATHEVVQEQEQVIASMSRLLNTLLDMSKLESGAVRVELQDFSLEPLFASLRADLGKVAQEKGLTLELPMQQLWVHSDPALVEQVLRNLISNAIKYTDRGRIHIAARIDGEAVELAVRDTGIGIPPEQLRYIFDEFYQVGTPSRSSREGYGLGLSIVQRIVRLLEARITVESQMGQGSVFTLRLPRASAAVGAVRPAEGAEAATEAASLARPLPRARVLLIEDDAGVRDATRMLLKVEGYQVTAVASIGEALAGLQGGPGPDLLVTDYHLANGETGTQAIQAIRDAITRPVKAILITGDAPAAARDMTRDPDLRIASKPVRAEELLALLRLLLAA